jgi:hypothetical protein
MERRYLTHALAVAAMICGITGLNRCSREDEEVADYISSSYPPRVFMKYRQIGTEYGAFAADYWLHTHSIYANREYHELLNTFDQDLFSEQINPAKAANFAIRRDTDRDNKIALEYLQLQADRPELKRRSKASERFKDMSPWLLVAICLGWLAKYFFEKFKTEAKQDH